ncbi:MAG TPA: hypothetical protein VEI25_05690, partial [Paraburkholderia sp.]|nr:hypothetical protein [Paraburkholderia sp.]
GLLDVGHEKLDFGVYHVRIGLKGECTAHRLFLRARRIHRTEQLPPTGTRSQLMAHSVRARCIVSKCNV